MHYYQCLSQKLSKVVGHVYLWFYKLGTFGKQEGNFLSVTEKWDHFKHIFLPYKLFLFTSNPTSQVEVIVWHSDLVKVEMLSFNV